MNTPVRVCPYYDAACNELPMKCEFCPERASTASAITDDFRGSTEQLIASITALIELDSAGALVPHGIGGHARELLAAAAVRLAAPTAQPVGQEKREPDPCDALRDKLESVIDYATGGKLSQSGWALATIKAAIDEHVNAAVEPSQPALAKD